MKRRSFLKASSLASGGLLISFNAEHLFAQNIKQSPSLGELIQIEPDGQVTIYVYKQEMGQGAATGLAMIAAEELDADWNKVQVKQLSFSKAIKGYESDWGRFDTGGSNAIETERDFMRIAGASARLLLLKAAASTWKVSLSECKAENGFVKHIGGNQKLSFGQLTSIASHESFVEVNQFKTPENYQIVGQSHTALKTKKIVTGQLKYSLDLTQKSMLYATIIRPPVLGNQLKSFDATAAKKVSGVVDIFELEPLARDELFDKGVRGGVVILANSTWASLKARNLIQTDWYQGVNDKRNCSEIYPELDKRKNADASVLFEAGDSLTGLENANKNGYQLVEKEYGNPYMAHGLMEPLNAIADLTDGKNLTVWAGTQSPQHSSKNLAEALGIKKSDIVINPSPMGGGYGRRYFVDFILEAAVISKLTKRVIKLTWTREDEIQFGTYHPLRKDYYRAVLDDKGDIDTMAISAVSTHIWAGAEMPITYGLKNYQAKSQQFDSKLVHWGSWRAVVKHQDTFTREVFMDELAEKAGRDPLDYRIQQFKNPSPKSFTKSINENLAKNLAFLKRTQIQLLEKIALLSKWNQKRPDNIGLGVAVTAFHDRSFCAQVAEIEIENNQFKVRKVYVTADVGQVINPNLVKAQIESSILWGLTPVLYGGIEVENGEVKQSNFHDMPLASMQDAPEIIIKLYQFENRYPAGVGEFAVTPVAPAISNAIFAATGFRNRQFPMTVA